MISTREGITPPAVSEKTRYYLPEVLARVPSLLAQLDREPHSQTFGCFDRDHWSWKFRDFPLGMMQTAVYPLALLWRFPFRDNPYHANPRVLEWIDAAIERTLSGQQQNGAFDAFAPNEQDVGSTLGVAHGLSRAFRLLRAEFSEERNSRFYDGLRRACDFAWSREENHGFISNHRAYSAVAFHDAAYLLGEAKYERRAEDLVESIIREQSADGWYREYEGPDPGYESLGIFHLATYWENTRSERLLQSLRRSVDFYAHCVHPDGSVGGVYGSRHTSLYFPGGFETLAAEIPLAASVAKFMRERLGRHNVLTPVTADAENLPSLLYTYLEACLALDAHEGDDTPGLPCETLDGLRHFPDSGITVAGTPSYFAITNAAKGGVTRVFDKRKNVIAYEDAGYVVRTGRRCWSSQLIGLGHRVEASGKNEIACTTQLAEIRQELATPARFVVLRLLNLTLFRSSVLGAWLRRLIVKELITKKRLGPFRMKRSVTFGSDAVDFCDELESTAAIHVDDVDLPRRFMAIHMGSAKYFHPSELEHTPLPDSVRDMASDLNTSHIAKVRFTVRFPAPLAQKNAVEVVVGEMEFIPQEEVLT